MKIKIDDLCKNLPFEFSEFTSYPRNLKFEEKPNYDFLKNLLYDVIKKENIQLDYNYDWIILKKKEDEKEKEKEKYEEIKIFNNDNCTMNNNINNIIKSNDDVNINMNIFINTFKNFKEEKNLEIEDKKIEK